MLEPQEGMTTRLVVERVKLAEELGFGAVFRSDHLLPTSGRRGIDSAECFVSLGAAAASTSKIHLGTLVSPLGFRNPALLAKMASSLQDLSNGRFELGVGAGWYEDEFRAFGIHYPGTKERIDRLRDALELIRPLVKEGRANYSGKYYSADVEFFPKPVPSIPLLVGGAHKSLVKLAAKYCDEWNFLYMPEEEFIKLKDIFIASRTGGETKISRMGPCVISEDLDSIKKRVVEIAKRRGYNEEYSVVLEKLRKGGLFIGTPAEVSDQLNAWLGLGVDRFMFQFVEPFDLEGARLLARELSSL
jgi:alkanesulfonate monooxygenase SsuD/methylene tetrahydromethanopterin reductase-like flavin-dependent oxidoreductase (luciferase family)